MQGQSCCQTGTGSAKFFDGKKIFLTKKNDPNNQGSYYTVNVCGNALKLLKEKQGFMTAAQANQFGLIGILLNKFLSKAFAGTPETSELDLSKITKIEVNTIEMPLFYGKIKNTTVWEVSPANATPDNYSCIISLKENELQPFVDAVKTIQPQVQYSQRS